MIPVHFRIAPPGFPAEAGRTQAKSKSRRLSALWLTRPVCRLASNCSGGNQQRVTSPLLRSSQVPEPTDSHMRQRHFIQCDVFTSVPTKGSGLAVVVDAEGLSEADIHSFAAWTNLAETCRQQPQQQASEHPAD
jgi:Phenazine biosynthesis-like protein